MRCVVSFEVSSENIYEKKGGRLLKFIIFCNVNVKSLPKWKMFEIIRKLVIAFMCSGFHSDRLNLKKKTQHF